MQNLSSKLIEELKTVLSGKTLDTIWPLMLFVLINGIFGLNTAVVVAVAAASVLGIIRLIRKQPWQYALAGVLGVVLASSMAFLTRSAVGYFIPAIAGNILLLVLAILSLALGKPLAAWASHLVRNWPLDWFWRKDTKPAYREVTWLWTAFFLGRLIIQVSLFQREDTVGLAWANILLGWPVTIAVLIISFIYGSWRLRQLGGPGVDEFREGTAPPWRGQTRGF